MNNREFDIKYINKIIKKIIDKIGESRNLIFDIVDNVRNEHTALKSELEKVIDNISKVIDEVDELEKQDKVMRKKLAEISSDFKSHTESEAKEAYNKALDIRTKFVIKQNEEKLLRERRFQLELSLKKSLQNIESGEKIINQISIALGYLENNVLSNIETENKNSELFIGIKILEAQENERKRIARDIHDGPAQYMANVIMKVDICRKVIEKDLEAGLEELAELKESVKLALKDVRSIIFDLRPMSLDDLGLNETIHQIVKTIVEESNIDIKLRLKPIETEIEPIIQVAVYRIIQEVFNNIKKHSKAKHAEVKLDFGTKYLMLIISDDGIGFDVEETLNRVRTVGASYGLIGIFDRVNQLQGEINIKSSRQQGTVYNVKLPINREVIRDEQRDD